MVKQRLLIVLLIIALGGGIAIGYFTGRTEQVDLDLFEQGVRAKLIDEGWVDAEDVAEITSSMGETIDTLKRDRIVREQIIANWEAKPATIRWLKPEKEIVEVEMPVFTMDCPDGTEVTCPDCPTVSCMPSQGDLEIAFVVEQLRAEDRDGPLVVADGWCEVQNVLMGWAARRPAEGFERASSIRFEREAPTIVTFWPKNSLNVSFTGDSSYSGVYTRYLSKRLGVNLLLSTTAGDVSTYGSFGRDERIGAGVAWRW